MDDNRALDIEIAKALGWRVDCWFTGTPDECYAIIDPTGHAMRYPSDTQNADILASGKTEAQAWTYLPVSWQSDVNAAAKLIEGDEDVTFEPPNRYNDNQWFARWHEYINGHYEDMGESGATFAECASRYWLRRQRAAADGA